MKSSRPWIVYTLIRVVIFALALTLLLLLNVDPYIAAVAAAVIGLCISYIFFRGKRDAVAKDIVARRSDEGRDDDNDLENEVLDRAASEKLERDGGGQPEPEDERGQAGQA